MSDNSRKYPCSSWKYSPIAPEGWWIVLVGLFGTLICYIYEYKILGAFFVVTFLFFLQFFRNPTRNPIPCPENCVLSSADGTIVYASPANDPYLNRTCIKISVFMSVFNVHANYSPIQGKIIKKWYYPGKFFNASLDKSSENNERCMLHIRTPQQQDIVCVQIAGLIARRVICYANQGDDLQRSQRYGFIRFGSRLDLYLPEDADMYVKIGETVRAGQNILAILRTVQKND